VTATMLVDVTIRAVAAALLHSLWQGALVATVTAVLWWVLRRSRPTARYALGCVALALMVGAWAATAWRTALRCASAIGGELRKAGFKPSLYHADPVYGESRAFADAQNGVHYFDHLAVLRRASMPAVLFEAGVIVNREEENRLSDSKVQNDIAARVVDGIESCVN